MVWMILQHTPAWVWALLGGLLALGLWQTRGRQVRRGQVLALPAALLAMGLSTMAPAFGQQPLAAALWLLALAAGTGLGRRWLQPRTARWLPAVQRLQLQGSWLPLVVILLIFSLRYAAGVAQGLNPAWRGLLAVQAPLTLLFGGLSGLLLGRALGLFALGRPTMAHHEHRIPV
jgi:hypothetical protein